MQMPEEHLEEYEQNDDAGAGLPSPNQLEMRWIMDLRHTWAEIEANLQGGSLDWDAANQKWKKNIPRGAQPTMNQVGITDVMAFARANINTATGTSVMAEPRVMQLCELTGYALLTLLEMNREEYALGPGKMDFVYRTIMNAFEANLRKSINGVALSAFTQTERTIRTETIAPENRRRIFG